MRFPQFIAVTSLALMCALAPAHAEKRVALVIGNDRYANLPAHEQLWKAVNDARAVGGTLRSIGFDVIAAENLGRGALVDKFAELMQRLSPGDTAFFFFSGHGVALDGVNYILPADVPDVGAAGQETRLKGAALGEQYIISELAGRGVRVAVVVLDACRTNPFARSGGKGVGGDKGLAPPPQVKGVFSFYAASSGQAARDRLSDDDPSPNSVFSRVLAPALARPGIDLATLAIEVREQVTRIAQAAGYDQRPAYYDETTGGRVYLAGAPPAGTPAASPDAAQAWGAVQNTTSIAVLDEFLRQFGNAPFYGGLARARREELAKKQAREPAAGPQPAPPATAHTQQGPGRERSAAIFVDIPPGQQQVWQGVSVHVCPVGYAMAGAHLIDNRFTCVRVIPMELENKVRTILDKGTQGNFGRGNMHVCPAGMYVRGLHEINDWLVCSDGAVLDRSFLDAAGATQGNRMHMCPTRNGQQTAMTGIHNLRNDFACTTHRDGNVDVAGNGGRMPAVDKTPSKLGQPGGIDEPEGPKVKAAPGPGSP